MRAMKELKDNKREHRDENERGKWGRRETGNREETGNK